MELAWICLALLFFCTTINARCMETDTQYCPPECDCSEFGVINCHGRGLDKIPDLPLKTSSLIMSQNKISSISQDDFAGCSGLHSLDLSANVIHKIEATSFASMRQLQQLYLHSNMLQLGDRNSSLPVGVLDPLSSLLELKLHKNMWKDTTQYRDDLVLMKPKLGILTLDSPRGNPDLPNAFSSLLSLKKLELYGGMTVLRNDTFRRLVNVSVEDISLLSGTLERLESMSLRYLRSMTSLDLSDNNNLGLGPNISQAWIGLGNTNIKQIFLRNVVPYSDTKETTLAKTFFVNLNTTKLEELYLDSNGLSRIEGSLTRNVPYLRKLSLSYNMFSNHLLPLSIDLYQMPHLRYIDISHHAQFPGLVRSLHNPISTSSLNRNADIFLPPNLSVLNVSQEFIITHFDVKYTVLHSLTTDIEVLDFSQNAFSALRQPILIQPPHNVNLKLLNVSGCDMDYMTDNVFQQGLVLGALDLSRNNMGNYIASVANGSMMRQFNSVQMKELILSQAGIKRIPSTFFDTINSLEKMHLDDNSLRSWDVSLQHMTNLSLLNLAGNMLSYFSQDTCDELDSLALKQHVTIDLSGNPLECQCYSLHFLRWLETTNVIVRNLHHYSCNIQGRLADFSNLTSIIHDMTISCSSTVWIRMASIALALLVVIVFLSVVLYRHRWDIRYVCLRVVRNRKMEQSLHRTYEFDAFVAYHQSDLTWVARLLIPRLEEGPNPLALCVHHRNWIPGPTIEENISRSVEACRKTLVILSKNFLQSGWCELEMQLARMRGLEEGEEVIVVVALEKILLRQMSSTLVNLRRTNTWLDWYEYENDQEQFWQLLRQALGQPSRINNVAVHPHGGGDDDLSIHSDDALLHHSDNTRE